MNKIIFLDIDGPVIPINVPIVDSIYRTVYEKDSIEYLNLLCEEANAKVVTNSMHNYTPVMRYDLVDDLISWGLDEKFIHDDWRTIFPHVDYTKVNSPVRGIGRLVAINDWIDKRNRDVSWVCFDDRKFTQMANLIHIEDGLGIRERHFDSALDIFSQKRG